MKYQRCQGMTVKERIFTAQDEGFMTRCIHCGNAIDTTVINNRGRFPLHCLKVQRKQT